MLRFPDLLVGRPCRFLPRFVLLQQGLGVVELSIRGEAIEGVGGSEEVAGAAFEGALVPAGLWVGGGREGGREGGRGEMVVVSCGSKRFAMEGRERGWCSSKKMMRRVLRLRACSLYNGA